MIRALIYIAERGRETIVGFRKSGRLGVRIVIFIVLILSLSSYMSLAYASEPSLIEIFNYFGFTNVTETTVETFPAGMYNVTLYAEFAGYSDENELSYYELGTSVFNVIFTGPEGGSGYLSPPINKTFAAGYQFGLSMLSPGPHRYFTETYKNPDGEQHAKVYKNLDDSNMFLIGFENYYGGGDRDYNDLVFSLECAHDLTVSAGVGGSTDPAGVSSHACGSYVDVTAIPEACYVFDHWELDGSPAGSDNPISVLMDDDHALHAVFTYSPPSVSVSISPLSASFAPGDSVYFTSMIGGGTSPYTYQWYLNGGPVSGATLSTWTFTTTSTGTYYVYLKIADACNTTAQSETAQVTVRTKPSGPVGGYSVSLTKTATNTPSTYYTMLLTIFGVAISLIRRKRK